MIVWIILLLVFAIVALMIYYYNKMVSLENKVDNAWSQIDVQLKKRANLVPNLVETVKGYAEHEKDVFKKVTKARSKLMESESPKQMEKADNMLKEGLKSLFAVAEDYPNLKASENFQKLQERLSKLEDKIAYARQFYNDIVYKLNTTVEKFPGNVFANIFHFEQRSMFEAEEGERETPEVKF